MALVVLLLGFFAIAAIFAYYLIVAILVAAGMALMIIAGISFMVGDAAGPIAGLMTFVVLTAIACVGLNEYFKEPERSGKHD